jgi:hypothetical protein
VDTTRVVCVCVFPGGVIHAWVHFEPHQGWFDPPCHLQGQPPFDVICVVWFQMFAAFSSAVTSNSVVTFLAEIMGAYFISVILLIRMAMPAQYRCVWLLVEVDCLRKECEGPPLRSAITEVIGHVEFNFFHRWSDFIFVVSAVLTIVVFVITRKARPGVGSDGVSTTANGAAVTVRPDVPEYTTTNYDRFKAYSARFSFDFDAKMKRP